MHRSGALMKQTNAITSIMGHPQVLPNHPPVRGHCHQDVSSVVSCFSYRKRRTKSKFSRDSVTDTTLPSFLSPCIFKNSAQPQHDSSIDDSKQAARERPLVSVATHQVLVSTPVVPSPSTVQCDILGNGKVGDCFFFRQFLLRRSRAKTRARPGQRARHCLSQTPSNIELTALP